MVFSILLVAVSKINLLCCAMESRDVVIELDFYLQTNDNMSERIESTCHTIAMVRAKPVKRLVLDV